MTFSDHPDNPCPPGLTGLQLTAADGTKLRAAFWTPPGEARGTVMLLQGRAEAIEKYYEVVGELLRRGFAVATMDWRGQGGSSRALADPRKGHVAHFAAYDADLAQFVDQVVRRRCPPPFIALAHSTGGLAMLRHARRPDSPFARIVLTAPLLGLGAMNPSTRLVGRLARLLSGLGLATAYPPGAGITRIGPRGFALNPLTGDQRRFERMIAIGKDRPDLVIGPPTIGWLDAVCRAMAEAETPAFARAITVPVLIVTAGSDVVVRPAAAGRMAAALPRGREIVIAESRHEILMERDTIRAAFWTAFDDFTADLAPARAELR